MIFNLELGMCFAVSSPASTGDKGIISPVDDKGGYFDACQHFNATAARQDG
jgi:hypothetical protein